MTTKHAHSKRGYAGILMILIGTAILILIFAKTYFTPTQTPQTTQPETTRYDQLQNNVSAAKATSEQLNKQGFEANQLLESIR